MTTTNDPYVMLHKVMADAFDVEDLQAMCFELGEDPENIGGDTKVLRCWKMIYFFRQRERLSDLMVRIETNRPNLADELALVKKSLAQASANVPSELAAPMAQPATPEPETKQPQQVKVQTPAASLERDLEPIIRKYAKHFSDDRISFLRTIPKNKLDNAIRVYAQNAANETPLMMFDSSLAGNGGCGFLLTCDSIYIRETGSTNFFAPWQDVLSIAIQKDLFGWFLVINGNSPSTGSGLDENEMSALKQMIMECAGLTE